jgi:hypothetical protein
MLHMFLICYDPTVPLRPDEPKSLQPQHQAVEMEMRGEGIYASGGALVPPEMVPPVRVKDGKTLATDGPFAESKELLGGYYVVECADMEDAKRQAARIPVGSNAWIEIRPLFLYHG